MSRVTMLVVAALVAACTPNLAQEPAEQFAARIDSAAAAGDSLHLGRLAEQRCTSLDNDARRTCWEDTFLLIADRAGVQLALGALADVGRREREVAGAGHGLTHVIGISAWKPGDDVAAAFRDCNGLYQSGCYHGVIQSYLTADGEVDSLRTAGLCDLIAPAGSDLWLRFQCVHGLGHGLEMAWNWDLPRALKGCDWLTSSWDREACYGGAFMENAVASQPDGHHTSVRALEAEAQAAPATDEHAHHQHGPTGTPAFKMRDSTDALYPCSVVEDRYAWQCYVGHGGILLAASGNDFGRAAENCDRAPEAFRGGCYLSLGTNASGWTLQDTERTVKLCSNGDEAYRPWCFVGAVKNYIDVTANPDDGIAFCREVPAGESQARCWRAIGEQAAVLHSGDMARRETVCAKVPDGEALAACRQGAQL